MAAEPTFREFAKKVFGATDVQLETMEYLEANPGKILLNGTRFYRAAERRQRMLNAAMEAALNPKAKVKFVFASERDAKEFEEILLSILNLSSVK